MCIYNYHIFKDHIDFILPGSIMTLIGPEEIKEVKEWITEAKSWATKDSTFKNQICNYLEFMFNDKYGF